jgi:hypothetical protein
MKISVLILLSLTLSLNCYSQISFEDGYFIKNSGQKVVCQIKNMDWKDNPTEFKYKLSNSDKILNNNIDSVKEFAIYNTSKYIRFFVKIDRSSNKTNELSHSRNAQFKEELLFLRVLIEGGANLHEYQDGILTRYFCGIDDSNIEQLVYQQYLTSRNDIGSNNRYRQQLWNNFQCSTISKQQIDQLDYKKHDLVDFFIKYNECTNQIFTSLDRKKNKKNINLSIRPGLNSSSLKIYNNNTPYKNVDFGRGLEFRFGVEAEFIMPFNNDKWAFIIEPTYQSYTKYKSVPLSGSGSSTRNVTAKYSSVELPIGFRHYMFLNDNSKLFMNASVVIDLINKNSKIDYELLGDLKIEPQSNLAFGLGYKYNNKYSIELRFFTNRQLFKNHLNQGSDYNTFSLIFGYTL